MAGQQIITAGIASAFADGIKLYNGQPCEVNLNEIIKVYLYGSPVDPSEAIDQGIVSGVATRRFYPNRVRFTASSLPAGLTTPSGYGDPVPYLTGTPTEVGTTSVLFKIEVFEYSDDLDDSPADVTSVINIGYITVPVIVVNVPTSAPPIDSTDTVSVFGTFRSSAVSSTAFAGIVSTIVFSLSMHSSADSSTALAGSVKDARLSMHSIARSSSQFGPRLDRQIAISVIGSSSTTMNGVRAIAGKIASAAASSSTMKATTRDDVLDVPRVIAEALSLWGFLCVTNAPAFAINRALNDLNQSMQLVWNNARERAFWSRSTITVTIAEDATTAALGNDIQNVIGPCRRTDSKRQLVPVGSIGEIETFPDLFLDGETASEPVAYHVERTIQSGTEPAKCVLHVYPAPASELSLSLDVVKEAPRYNLVDVQQYTPLTIPHKYVETLLLPVLRYHASTFYLFQAGDMKETIDREYQQAKISLGLVDPLPGKAGDNREERPS